MAASTAKCKPALGFLTVVEHPQLGLIGGYLLLNGAGRPLEFHCTAPVKPNRAQEILYGPTLRPYLYGEQIGRTLVGQSRLVPLVVFTDCEDILATRQQVDVPMALVARSRQGIPSLAEDPPTEPAAAGQDREGLIAFAVGDSRLAVPLGCEADRDTIVGRLTSLALKLDLAEPFGRIRAAIDEAQKAA